MENKDIAGFFLDKWYVFDNFAPFQIEWRGKLYPTSEHAYQSARFLETAPDICEQTRLCGSPAEAFKLSRANSDKYDPDWNNKKVAIMTEIVTAKLNQHQIVKDTLIASGDKYIVEMNDNDEFWGWGTDHNGNNELGKIWMRLRDKLAAGTSGDGKNIVS